MSKERYAAPWRIDDLDDLRISASAVPLHAVYREAGEGKGRVYICFNIVGTTGKEG